MRTSTNLYLLNLALSDLLLSVICMPVTVIVTIYRSWLFGDILCKIFIYIQPVSVSASAYTLAAIAMERYIAICKPFQSRMVQTKSHACLMICIVWSVAFIVNLGYLFNIENKSYDPNNLNLKMCSSSATEKTKFFYQIYVTIVLLVVPLILMGVLYGYVISSLKMGIKMDIAAITIEGNNEISTFQGNETNKKQSKISIESVKRKSNNTSLRNFTSEKMLNIEGKKLPVIEKSSTSSFLNNSPYENTNDEKNPSQIYGKQSIATIDTMVRSTHSSKIILTKQRLIRMLIVIVIIFFICWTPTNIYWLLVAASEYFSDETLWDGNINLVLTSIAYLATCANPITYCFLNAKFRNALLHVWGCKKYDHRPNNFKAYHNNDKYCIKQELGTCESTSNIRVTNNKDNKVPVSQNLLKQYRHSISTNDYTSIMTNEKKKSPNSQYSLSSPQDFYYPDIEGKNVCFENSGYFYDNKKSFNNINYGNNNEECNYRNQARRDAANERERKRMKSLNKGFDELRQKLPAPSYKKKLSKVDTLKQAITYIQHLHKVLQTAENNKKCAYINIIDYRHSTKHQKNNFVESKDDQYTQDKETNKRNEEKDILNAKVWIPQ
uniref:G_PROTEIN_RECEP_F1_2 domain-containing protein n=1 Tax=Parastrongyloides trichosuri TaxID=131310 RepID=A0A0N5A246_PARTI